MKLQFVAQLDQFDRGKGESVSQLVVMVEEHFSLWNGAVFLQFSVDSAQ